MIIGKEKVGNVLGQYIKYKWEYKIWRRKKVRMAIAKEKFTKEKKICAPIKIKLKKDWLFCARGETISLQRSKERRLKIF